MNIAKKFIILTLSGLSITIGSVGIYATNIAERQGQSNRFIQIKQKIPKNMKSILSRFAKGDKTLNDDDFAIIYYQYNVKNGYRLQQELTSLTDKYIKQRLFQEAQQCAEGAISSIPYDIGLLNRVCDLTQHNKSDKVDLYVWQLASLLHIINRSGNGESFDSAYKVRSLRDAYLFETLWLQTPMNDIKGKAELSQDGKKYYVLTIKNNSGNIIKNYYQIVQEPIL